MTKRVIGRRESSGAPDNVSRSVAWRADADRSRRRITLVTAVHPEARRFDDLSRRAIAAVFGHLDWRLSVPGLQVDSRPIDGPPLSVAEREDLAALEVIADELRRAS